MLCIFLLAEVLLDFFHVSGWEYSDHSIEFPEPPAISLLVVNIDDISWNNKWHKIVLSSSQECILFMLEVFAETQKIGNIGMVSKIKNIFIGLGQFMIKPILKLTSVFYEAN